MSYPAYRSKTKSVTTLRQRLQDPRYTGKVLGASGAPKPFKPRIEGRP